MRALDRSHAVKLTNLVATAAVTRTSLALIAGAALAGAALPAVGLFAGAAAAAPNPNCSASAGVETCVFSYNGSSNINGTAISWPVPSGVTSLNVIANGADGGSSGAAVTPGAGGNGGQVKATLTGIPASTTLLIFPGGRGIPSGAGGVNQRPGLVLPAGGGGAGAGVTADGGSGGGASTVAISGGIPFNNLLVVAGGGGGGSSTLPGGDGGTSHHPVGDSGESSGFATGGGGGTLLGGGAAGSNGLVCLAPALPGSALQGGIGGGVIVAGCANGGGGGGGGYYGGGGGGGQSGAGGGGSAYPGAVTTVGGITVTPDTHDGYKWTRGNGQITIKYNLIPTTTTVSGNPNPSNPSQPVTLTATVSPSDGTGTVNFENGNTTITGCGSQPLTLVGVNYQATCTTSTLPSGSNTINAVFNPATGSAYETSTGTTTQVVKTPTTTTLSSSPNPSDFGQSVALSAIVSPTDGGGSVDFKNGGVTISGCGSQPLVDVAGTYIATCHTTTLPAGTDNLTAVYSGDNAYLGSTSNTVDQDVRSSPTRLRTWFTVTPNGIYTLHALLTSDGSGLGGETITFTAGRGSTLLCTASTDGSGLASCTLTGSALRDFERTWGAYTATFAGDTNYESSSAFNPGILV